jgi:hypothetical protein
LPGADRAPPPPGVVKAVLTIGAANICNPTQNDAMSTPGSSI